MTADPRLQVFKNAAAAGLQRFARLDLGGPGQRFPPEQQPQQPQQQHLKPDGLQQPWGGPPLALQQVQQLRQQRAPGRGDRTHFGHPTLHPNAGDLLSRQPEQLGREFVDRQLQAPAVEGRGLQPLPPRRQKQQLRRWTEDLLKISLSQAEGAGKGQQHLRPGLCTSTGPMVAPAQPHGSQLQGQRPIGLTVEQHSGTPDDRWRYQFPGPCAQPAGSAGSSWGRTDTTLP